MQSSADLLQRISVRFRASADNYTFLLMMISCGSRYAVPCGILEKKTPGKRVPSRPISNQSNAEARNRFTWIGFEMLSLVIV